MIDFASHVARDASSITAADLQRLRDLGLDEAEIVDVVLAAAARAFFTKVLDGLGVQADAQLGERFDPEVRDQVTVGRPDRRGVIAGALAPHLGQTCPASPIRPFSAAVTRV